MKPAAWEAYASGTELDSFAEFCERYLVLSEDRWAGMPLILEDFQRRVLGEALAVNEEDQPVWSSVVWVMPRKNAKTATLAAFSVYRVFDEGNPEILLCASSEKQASKLFDFSANFVRRNEELSGLLRVRDHEGEIIREDGLGKIVRMSSDPRRLHGYGPTLVVADELGQWTTPQLERAFAALTSGGGARSTPQNFTITTPGEAHLRHTSILGRLLDGALAKGEVEREPGLTIARDFEGKRLVYNHEAPTSDPSDIASIKLANPAPWITEEYLEKQHQNDELTDSQFLQLHGCVWAERSNSWLPAGSWDKLAVPERQAVDGEEIALAFDGSERRDSTVLIGCIPGDVPHLFVVAVWEKPENVKDWKVPRGEVTAVVDDTFRRFDVFAFPGDPPGWGTEREDWAEKHGSPPVVDFNTRNTSLMAPRCAAFRTAVIEGDLTHDGNPVLAKHIANAVTKSNAAGTYITKDHPDSPLKIDAAVGSVLAYDAATSDAYSVEPLIATV